MAQAGAALAGPPHMPFGMEKVGTPRDFLTQGPDTQSYQHCLYSSAPVSIAAHEYQGYQQVQKN